MVSLFGSIMLVALLGALLGLATVVKPFWFVKSRKRGAQLAFGSLAVALIAAFLTVAFAPPMPERPSTISEEEWAARSAVCTEAGLGLATCIGDDAEVERARTLIAGRAQAREEAAAEAAQAAEEAAARAAQREQEAAAADLANREIAWIGRTKDAVRERLRNPSSAEFRNVELYRPFPGRDTPVVCGEVNSENGFGGMSGFQGFIGSGSTVGPFLEEDMGPGEFARSRAEMCVNAPAPTSPN